MEHEKAGRSCFSPTRNQESIRRFGCLKDLPEVLAGEEGPNAGAETERWARVTAGVVGFAGALGAFVYRRSRLLRGMGGFQQPV